MPGLLVRIIDKQRYDFTWLGMNASQTITLAPAISVVPYYYGQLSLRIHAISGLTGTQAIALEAYGTNPSSSDPQEFSKSTAILAVTLGTSTTAPSLESDSASDLDPFLKLTLKFTQTSTAGTALWAELSADLLLREG